MSQNLWAKKIEFPTSMAATGWIGSPKLRISPKCNSWNQIRRFVC